MIGNSEILMTTFCQLQNSEISKMADDVNNEFPSYFSYFFKTNFIYKLINDYFRWFKEYSLSCLVELGNPF